MQLKETSWYSWLKLSTNNTIFILIHFLKESTDADLTKQQTTHVAYVYCISHVFLQEFGYFDFPTKIVEGNRHHNSSRKLGILIGTH